MTSNLLELADRVEKATGQDRVIDYEIRHVLKGGEPHERIISVSPAGPHSGYETVHYEGGGISQGSEPSRYTASIDAALTLVPEGMNWLVRKNRDERTAFANVSRSDANNLIDRWNAEDACFTGSGEGHNYSTAATPALALCAAALRARASGPSDE